MFFFEKKNQKTFATWHARPRPEWAAYAKEQKFLLLFFKKEDFLCHGSSRSTGAETPCVEAGSIA
jgi:hypothetical protein